MAANPAGGPDPTVAFQPPLALRWALGAAGALSLITATLEAALALTRGPWERTLVAGLLLLPAVLALGICRRRIEAGPGGLRSVDLAGERLIPWSQVHYMDQTRRSLVVETAAGAVSAGWIAPSGRDRLMRLVMQYARLTPSRQPVRFGLKVRFVPRQQPVDIQFRPPGGSQGKADST